MFSCFGVKGERIGKERKMTHDEVRNLRLEVGNNVLRLNMYEKLLREYHGRGKESVLFGKESNIIKNTIETVLMRIKLAETNVLDINIDS